MTRLSVKYKKVDALIPYARNSRTHSDAQVAQIAGSIKEFGFTNPVLIDEEGGIIAGHGRVLAAMKIGMAEVPTILLSGLTPAQKRAYIIADNRLPLNAGWDFEMLAVELDELRDLDFDLPLLGFEKQELNDLIGTPNTGSFPELPDGDRDPFQNLTFTLSDAQADMVKEAIAKAKSMGAFDESVNENSNGNALARICSVFLNKDVFG